MSITPYLTAQNISMTFGGKPLFEEVTFSLMRGDRVCLVGRNGCGKSTLLKVLAHELDHDHGSIFHDPKITCAYLKQDLHVPHGQTVQQFLESHRDLDPIQAHIFFDQLRVPLNQDMAQFSGGERRRLALALTLAKQSDILLLDEPTNHLDIQIIEWLEQYLARFKGALIVISHDRSFLSTVTNRTFWVHHNQVLTHDAGYTDFDTWSELVLAEDARQLDRLDVKLRQENHWLQRGVTARRKRNQGRLRQLHALRATRRAHTQNKAKSLTLEGPTVGPHWTAHSQSSEFERGSTCILEAHHLTKSFGERTLFKNFSVRIMRGDRIGIVGPNGAGKTTLLNILLNKTKPDEGTLDLGETLTIVYFDQLRDTLNGDETLWQTLCPHGGDHVRVFGKDRHVAGYLKDFLFEDKHIHGKVSILSGGEKNRLALAKALMQNGNVLVLDEPTNDLDMDTLDVLEDMLIDYPGTIIVVSHDRDFLNQTVTSILALEGDGTVREYMGGYDDYKQKRDEEHAQKYKKMIIDEPKAQRVKTVSKRLSYHETRLLETLPKDIEDLESKIERLSTQLADPDLYIQNPDQFYKLTHELDQTRQRRDAKEEQWLELSLKADEVNM